MCPLSAPLMWLEPSNQPILVAVFFYFRSHSIYSFFFFLAHKFTHIRKMIILKICLFHFSLNNNNIFSALHLFGVRIVFNIVFALNSECVYKASSFNIDLIHTIPNGICSIRLFVGVRVRVSWCWIFSSYGLCFYLKRWMRMYWPLSNVIFNGKSHFHLIYTHAFSLYLSISLAFSFAHLKTQWKYSSRSDSHTNGKINSVCRTTTMTTTIRPFPFYY